MVTNFNRADMISFANYASQEARSNGRKDMFPGDLDNWKSEQDTSKRKEFWFQLKNESSGAFIEMSGKKAKEAYKDFEDCLENLVTFEWSGMQIQTNDSDWKYRTSDTIGTDPDPWLFMGAKLEPLFEYNRINEKMVNLLDDLMEMYSEYPATAHGGKHDIKVNEIIKFLTDLKDVGNPITMHLFKECKSAIIEAVKMSLNCPNAEIARAAVNSAKWWWSEKMFHIVMKWIK